MNIPSPIITTVIPTYRRPKLLQRAIRSVLNQTYQNLQINIFDNASRDETAEVVAAIARQDSRVHYYCHSENRGALYNLNYGMNQVSTPFFSILADDDILLPDFYLIAIKTLESYPKAMFFCSKSILNDQLKGRIYHLNKSWKNGYYKPTADTAVHMIRDNIISTGIVFNSNIRDSVGFFDDFGSDRNYLVKAASICPFVVSECECAVLIIHASSFSGGVVTNVKFYEGANISQNSEYFRGCFYSLFSILFNLPSLCISDKDRIFHAAIVSIRHHLTYYCFAKSLSANKPEEILDTLYFLDSIGLGLHLKILLKIIAFFMQKSRMSARMLSLSAKIVLTLRNRLKKKTELTQFESDVIWYISNGCNNIPPKMLERRANIKKIF